MFNNKQQIPDSISWYTIASFLPTMDVNIIVRATPVKESTFVERLS